MEISDTIFFLIGFLSEIIGTMAGFGSSTIFLPFASYFIDFKTALVLVAIFHLFGNISRITFFRHGLNKNVLLFFGVPSFVLSLVGAVLVGDLPQTILKLILGIFLISIILNAPISRWPRPLLKRPWLLNLIALTLWF